MCNFSLNMYALNYLCFWKSLVTFCSFKVFHNRPLPFPEIGNVHFKYASWTLKQQLTLKGYTISIVLLKVLTYAAKLINKLPYATDKHVRLFVHYSCRTMILDPLWHYVFSKSVMKIIDINSSWMTWYADFWHNVLDKFLKWNQ